MKLDPEVNPYDKYDPAKPVQVKLDFPEPTELPFTGMGGPGLGFD